MGVGAALTVVMVGCSGGTGDGTDTMVTTIMPTNPTTNPTNPTTSTTDPTTTNPTTNPTTTTTNPTDPSTSTGTTTGTSQGPTGTSAGTDTDATTGPPPELNTQCLVVHRGGSPAELATVRVDVDGTLTDLEQSLMLGGGHSPDTTDYRRTGIVTCGSGGRYVHAAQLDNDRLTSVEVGYYGELTELLEIEVPNIEGVLCDPDEELLFAFGRNSGSAAVRTFSVMEDGTLEPEGNGEFDFLYTADLLLYATLHPELPVLYLGGKTTGMNQSIVEIHKIDYSDSGQLVPDNKTALGGNLLFGIDVAPSGDELPVVAWNGAFAWHNLPGSGAIPAQNQLTIINDNQWQGGNDIEVRTDPSSDEHFYYAQTTGPNGQIIVGEFLGDQVMYYDTVTGAGKRMHLHLAYNDDVLIAVAQTGEIKTWEIDSEGVVLTDASELDLGGTDTQASALVPCAVQG